MGEDQKADELASSASGSSGSSTLAPGLRFARYKIVRKVGSGGMGSVYEALLVDLNKRVALKVLSPELANKGEHRARFVREGQAAARIRHPNVVEIFDVGEHEGLPFLAMEFLVGHDLRARYDQGPLAPIDLLDLMLPVLAAVVTAHDAQVIHRDLKPENIFLNEHPGHGVQPVVLDFGISKVIDDLSGVNLTGTSTMVGTPLYMSPEQVQRSREVDPRTDQYALGAMLYEGLTGVCPFTGTSLYDLLVKKVQGDLVPVRTLKPELPEALCSAVERAMAADRERRFSNVRALSTALMPFARERTRAIWGAVLSAQTGDPMTPQGIDAAAGVRADSTLRSSVKDLPMVTADVPSSRNYRVPAVLAALGLLVAIGIVAARAKLRGETSSGETSNAAQAPIHEVGPIELYTVQTTTVPATARIALDGEAIGVGWMTKQLVKDGRAHTLEISAEGFEPKRFTFTDVAPAEHVVQLIALPPAVIPAEPTAAVVPDEAAPAAAANEQPRPRKSDGAARAPASTTAAQPAAASTTEAQSPKGPRRTVGSNDAPVLY